MTDRLSLSVLRKELGDAHDERSLTSWIARLRDDPRAGATALADQARRRLERIRGAAERQKELRRIRRALRRRGVLHIAGVDEAGMGPLAGPVIAAAVILPDGEDLPELDDSKKLTADTREQLAAAIRGEATAWAIGRAEPTEIDRLNIYHAGLLAMRRAVESLLPRAEHVLVDARRIPGIRIPQTSLVRGDAREVSIAAASIVAKVARDAEMAELDRRFPGYGFARHKGYPTPDHLAALAKRGPSAVHRRSFAPVARAAAP